MVDVGETMVNRGAGESYVWRATRTSTGGEYSEAEVTLAPTATPPARHRHPKSEERFTVVEGAIELDLDGRTQRIEAGQTIAVPPNTAHIYRNVAPEGSRIVLRITPSHTLEDFFAGLCAIDAAGRSNASGLPKNPIEFAVLADDHRQDIVLATDGQQRVGGGLLHLLAKIGRRQGLGPKAYGRA